MQDTAEETAKPEPDNERVGNALERVAKSAKAAGDFSENAEKIVPRLVASSSWLGPAGRRSSMRWAYRFEPAISRPCLRRV